MFKRNVPGWERALRAACGTTLLVVAGGVGLLGSAAVGFCPACALAGRRLS